MGAHLVQMTESNEKFSQSLALIMLTKGDYAPPCKTYGHVETLIYSSELEKGIIIFATQQQTKIGKEKP